MVGDSADFDALAERAGIARAWNDIDGRHHEVPAEPLRALLEAMHLDWRHPADALDALEAAIPPGLAPFGAAFVDEPIELPVRLPAGWADGSLRLTAVDAGGRSQQAVIDAEALALRDGPDRLGRQRAVLPWPFAPNPGEYALRLEGGGIESQGRFVLAPAMCWHPARELHGAGLSTQVYALRDRRGHGIGDLESLARVGEWFGRHGGAVVLANPLGGPVDPRTPTLAPYSPSSRLTIDPVYLPDAAAHRSDARVARIGDIAAMRAEAWAALSRAHRALVREGESTALGAFRAWCAAEAGWLEPHAAFAARIRQAMESGGDAVGWDRWPAEWRDPRSPAVASWAATAAETIDRERHALWRLEQAALEADRRGRAAGLALGIGHDLPLGCARHGAETWSEPGAFALDASLGAPPDPFCRDGQDWGLPPLLPYRLEHRACEPWRRPLVAAMRRGGLVRIDHVMGLDRLWWIPGGGRSADGAYVRYPASLLLPLLVHDSHVHRCVVVGEDLGTVDPALRERLSHRGVLSTRVLRFERGDDGGFRPPDRYPARAWVTVGTHDLPGAIAHRRGSDLGLRASSEERAHRQAEIDALAAALHAAGIDPGSGDDTTWLAALHRFLAATPSALVGVQAEDLVAHAGQVNVPGSISPENWSHRLEAAIEQWDALPSVRVVLEALAGRLVPDPADVSESGG
jgi:(1->4)-alpha-D-glucan 1-alpha-D-glucosylmutase